MLKTVKATGLLLLLCGLALAATPDDGLAPSLAGQREEPARVEAKPIPPEHAPVQQWQAGPAPVVQTDAQWDPEVRITTNTVTDYTPYYGHHSVVVDPSGRVHVAWFSYQTPGSYSPQIYYKRYYPGTGWTSDTCISADLATRGASQHPSLAVDSSGVVHAVWQHYSSVAPTGYRIYYKNCTPTASGNGGWAATSDSIYGTRNALWIKYYPTIASSPNGNIYVTWYQYYSSAGYMVPFAQRTSGGVWSYAMVDSGATTNYRWTPYIAAGRNNDVHIAWYGYHGTTYYQVGYRGRFSGTWGAIQVVSAGSSYYQYYPSLAVHPTTNRVHCVWQGYDNGFWYYRIMHKERLGTGTGAGDTWQLVADTVSEPGLNYYQYQPSCAFTADGRMHATWYGQSATSPSYYQVRYNDRSPAGAWGTPINFSTTSYYRYYPNINNGGNSANPNDVHVVWTDGQFGTYEIMYRHGAPPPPNDVGVSKIVQPNGLYEAGAITPMVYVKNYGTASQSGFGVKLDIGGSYTSTATVSSPVAPGDSVLVTSFAVWNPSTSGTYPVACSTRLTGDQNNNNDKKTATALIADFVEKFDPGNGGYSANSGWVWRVPAWPRPPAPSPTHAWSDPDSGYYVNSAVDRLVSCPYFATQDTPVFVFQWYLYSETWWDGGGFWYSTDDGSSWTVLFPDTAGGKCRPYYSGTLWSGEYGWSGGPFGWELGWFKIPVSNGTPFRVRWSFTSDGSVTYVGGMMVDDVAGLGARKPYDVSATQIVEPVGTIPWGSTVNPQAWVKNKGAGTQTFNVRFDIGTVYNNTQTVTSLAPGDSVLVLFSSWVASVPGNHATKCSTQLAIDDVTGNDKVEGTTFVQLFDVGATNLIQPLGQVPIGTVVQPRATWHNYGSQTANATAFMKIGTTYTSSRLIINLPPGADTTLNFPNWTASTLGTFPVTCSTRLTGDQIPANDTLYRSVEVVNIDVGADAIVQPTASVYVDDIVVPTVTVQNYGSISTTFDLRFTITDATPAVVYDTTEQVTLTPGEIANRAFTKTWTATPIGAFTAQTYCNAAGDANRSNDTFDLPFQVTARYTEGWVEMTPMPAGAKAVKDGGFLTRDEETGFIYGAKGNKVPEFYTYDPAGTGGTWTTKDAIPLGSEAKAPGKGCMGQTNSMGKVWVAKGNSTLGFHLYVDSTADGSWRQLSDVPLSPSGKKVKGGTDMCYVVLNDTGYVYFLKGYKTDFFRFNTVSGVWDTSLPPAPTGAKDKWDKGSWIAFDGDHTIWAHKAKYHELYSFDVLTNAWSSMLPGMPLLGMMGKSKKSKDGGSGAYHNGALYALKGGNTQEFWKYEIGDSGAGTWTELDTMPAFGSTGKKKRVKAGGDIVSSGDGAFYALKGNKTNEFWRWFRPAAPAARPGRSGVMADIARLSTALKLGPNPVVGGRVTLRYALPQAGPLKVAVFDITGRNVATQSLVAGRTGSTSLDLRHLSAGVYLVKVEATGYKATRKLVVQ